MTAQFHRPREATSVPGAPRALRVAVLLYPGLCAIEYAIVAELLEWGDGRPRWYRHETFADSRGAIRARHGLSLTPDAGLEALETADILIAPGWAVDGPPPSPGLVQAIRRFHARGGRLVGICTGAFLFGAAGLLRGRRVTTHWERAATFRSAYPAAELLADHLYVDDGDILTASGSAAGLDLLVHMVSRDFGLGCADELACHHTLGPHRAGEQAQRVRHPLPVRGPPAISGLLDEIRGALHESWTVDRMASRLGMSPRTLTRRFAQATGCSPGTWITLQRLTAAQALLANGRNGVEQVAEAVGLGSAAALRHHFRRRLGVSPSLVRRRVGGTSAPRAAGAPARQVD